MCTAPEGEAYQHAHLVNDQGHREARDFLGCPEAQHGAVGPHVEASLDIRRALRVQV